MLRLCFIAALFALAFADQTLMQMRRLGFDQDHKAFSHEIIVPWLRPFKPGYCESWEWHTDERYKQRRIDICRSLNGEKKHDCDAQSGFCRDKCPYTNGSYPYWRIRNAENLPYLWTIRTIQFFDSANSRAPLNNNPDKGYASTFFGPGYYPSNAFDNNADSLWASNGISTSGLNWLAYEFPHPVKISSIRIVGEAKHPDGTPAKIYVEASCDKYFKIFSNQWLIENRDRITDKRFSRPRQANGRW